MYNEKTMAKIRAKSEEIIARFREELPKMSKDEAAVEANMILYVSNLYSMRPTTPQGWQNWRKWLEQYAIYWLGYEEQCFLWRFTKRNRKAKEQAKRYWQTVKANYEANVLAV